MSYIVHIQLAKDTFAACAFLLSAGLVWLYTNELILACGVLAFAIDCVFTIHHVIMQKFTMSQLKDFCGAFVMLVYVVLTLFASNPTKYRLAYAITFGILGLTDLFCVVVHLTGVWELYSERLDVKVHDSVANVVRLNEEYVDPY